VRDITVPSMHVLDKIETNLQAAGAKQTHNGLLTEADYRTFTHCNPDAPALDEILTIFTTWTDALVFAFGPTP
jgi:hypothetical protein